jgi:sodium pump decarboxylase gamma subunit
MYILAINWASAFNVVMFGFVMVFIILILLVVVISLFGKVLAPKVRVPKVAKINNEPTNKKVATEYIEDHLTANYSAAIAMALHLYYSEAHDEESHIITIKTVERRYSPWSSKIYGINNLVK